MDADDKQVFRKLAHDVAEKAAIYHAELVKVGIHQDQAYLMTQQFAHHEMQRMRNPQPELDHRTMNKLVERMAKTLLPEEDEDA